MALSRKEYELFRIRSKLIARRRIWQFFVYACIIVPLVAGLTFLFQYASLATWASILIDIVIIFVFWFVCFYLIIKPIERYQQRLRKEEKEKRSAKEANASAAVQGQTEQTKNITN